MVMDIRRVISARSTPVGFQRFFDGLMTHEGDIKPSPRLIQRLSCAYVVVGNFHPICHLVCYHGRLFLFPLQK